MCILGSSKSWEGGKEWEDTGGKKAGSWKIRDEKWKENDGRVKGMGKGRKKNRREERTGKRKKEGEGKGKFSCRLDHQMVMQSNYLLQLFQECLWSSLLAKLIRTRNSKVILEGAVSPEPHSPHTCQPFRPHC